MTFVRFLSIFVVTHYIGTPVKYCKYYYPQQKCYFRFVKWCKHFTRPIIIVIISSEIKPNVEHLYSLIFKNLIISIFIDVYNGIANKKY